MSRKRLELTGQKFGRLTVIKFSHINKSKNTCWLCKCRCGKETIVRGYSLKYGDTKSCGCLKKEFYEKHRLPKGIAARNDVIYAHKNRAKQKNLEQALTDEQIIALHKENCHYCGVPPSNILFPLNYNGSYTYSGIDRVDSNKGYTIDNVVSCCIDCNRAKNDLTYDEFSDLIKRIHSHLNL